MTKTYSVSTEGVFLPSSTYDPLLVVVVDPVEVVSAVLVVALESPAVASLVFLPTLFTPVLV